MRCEMCGRETELYRAIIEGSQLTVCNSCAKYGKITGRFTEAAAETRDNRKEAKKISDEPLESVVSNFGEILKKKREELGMTHKDFAAKIAEKESVLRKLETGSVKPTLERARQLERMLGIRLVEELKDEQVETKKGSPEVTLGDVVKIKVRKKA